MIIYIYARFPCAAETESARYGPTFGGVSFQTFGVFWFRVYGSGSDLWIFAALFLVVSDPQRGNNPPHIHPLSATIPTGYLRAMLTCALFFFVCLVLCLYLSGVPPQLAGLV